MYELVDFAADKLGRTVFFDSSLSTSQKTERALKYGDLMLRAFQETGEAFFLMIASSFLGRMENDLFYRGGSDEQVIAVMDKHLYAMKMLEELRADNAPLHNSFERYAKEARDNLFKFNIDYRTNAKRGRRAELLKNPDYKAVLDKYK